MILSQYVEVKISNNQIKYYILKGYDVKGNNEIRKIKVSDLPLNSGQKIEVQCDICSNKKIITMNRYQINTNNGEKLYTCSRKCAEFKNKQTCLDNYGVDNISKLESVKIKKIETCLDNYGVEFPQQSEKIFEKSKNTKKLKYNDENYNNLKKRIQTCLNKYGCVSPSQNTNIKKKMKINQFESNKEKILEKYKDLKIVNFDKDDKYVIECDCDQNHTFNIEYKLLWQRVNAKTTLCTVCNEIDRKQSGLEINLINFIEKNYNGEILIGDRDVIKPLELDIYLPDLKLAFEFNGLYWHNELNKENNYHLNKTENCVEKDTQLIHIWEDDWLYKQHIVKSMILNKLGNTPTKIYARKCKIEVIQDNKLIRNFLDENHLQGFVGSSIKLGLYYERNLVSLMTFGKSRKSMGTTAKEGDYELIRFCNKLNTNVIGGAGKLFKHFTRNYSFNEITSYADRSHSNGKLYENLGFEFVSKTKPNYYYIIEGLRKYRFSFRKDILIKEGFDPNKSEHEIMLGRGIYRIYNSGNLKYKYKKVI